MKFANVIVDISHEKLDRPFGYIIPDELEKEITVGTAVTIPFGKGNRQIKGYVIEITDQPSFDISKMKEIMAVEEGARTGCIQSQPGVYCIVLFRAICPSPPCAVHKHFCKHNIQSIMGKHFAESCYKDSASAYRYGHCLRGYKACRKI